MTLYPKRWISDVVDVQIFEIGKNFSGQTAVPSDYTGGTQIWVPRNPWVDFWVSRNLYWRNLPQGSASSVDH